MSDQHDVRRIARALPETTEDGHHFRVGGKLFVWFYPERVHPKKPRVINHEVVVVAVPTLEDKGALIGGDPETFFTTPHYDGYKAVLVRLARDVTTMFDDLRAVADRHAELHCDRARRPWWQRWIR